MISFLEILNFLFNYEIYSSFACVLRIISTGYLLFCLFWIRKDAWNFSSPNGPFGNNDYKNFAKQFNFQLSLFSIFNDRFPAQKFIFISFYISGLFSLIGFFTNISLFVFLIMLMSIQNRILPIIYSAADSISRILIICLAITDCGSQYSLDNILGLSSNQNIINGTGIRVLQISICMIYFWSSVYKLRDTYWLDGETIKNAIATPIWGTRWCLKFWQKNIVSKSITWSVLIFEYFAPALFFIKETRNFAIIYAILMHVCITIFMRIGYFGPIMIISVLSFCNDFFK